MARINTRPDIIYIKDMSEQDKDFFEKILKDFETTNNGEAVKKLFREYHLLCERLEEKTAKVSSLKKELALAEKEKLNFLNNTEKLIKSFSSVEENLKSAKMELKKLK